MKTLILDVGPAEMYLAVDRRLQEVRPRSGWLAVLETVLWSTPSKWIRSLDSWEDPWTLILVGWLHLWPEESLPLLSRMLAEPRFRLLVIVIFADYGTFSDYRLTDAMVDVLEPLVDPATELKDEEAEAFVGVLVEGGHPRLQDLLQRLVANLRPDMPMTRRELQVYEVPI